MTKTFTNPVEAKAYGLGLEAKGRIVGVRHLPATEASRFHFPPVLAEPERWEIVDITPTSSPDTDGEWGTSVGNNGWMCDD